MNFRQRQFQSFNPNFQIPKRNHFNNEDHIFESRPFNTFNSSQTDCWNNMNNDAYEQNFYGHYNNDKNIGGKYGAGVFGGKIKNNGNFNKRPAHTAHNNKPYLKHKLDIVESDHSLPEDLRKMFEPLKCQLCQAVLTSTVMAKIHYGSNNHEKKIRKWLIEYSERTGEPLHKRVNAPPKTKEDDNDPKYFRCDLCDIPLTGKLHAESHYMGKTHISIAMGRTAPARKKESTEENLSCQVCQVSVTSPSQLQAHMIGSKHKKKLKAMELIGKEINANEAALNDNVEKKPRNSNVNIDSSIVSDLRCNICSLNFNSKIQLVQHLQSKKHERKLQKENEVKMTEKPTVSQEEQESKTTN